MGSFSIWHWLIVLVIVLLLFGAKRLPDLATGLGKSIKNFKGALKEEEGEKTAEKPSEPSQIVDNQPSSTHSTAQSHEAPKA
jgi:sec-independent protein translocase protein TatA